MEDKKPEARPQPRQGWKPGITIGKYRVLHEVTRGGFWVAYLAEDKILERKVLLRLPLADAAADEKLVQRLYQQAKLMAKLKHPNIVALHDVGEYNGKPFLAVEYVAGQDLESLLEKDGALPVPVLLRIMATIAGALQHAHDHLVLHKDIKPRSIMLATDGEPVLWNFGLASPISGDPLLEEGMIAGTPAFMAPEQATGSDISLRADIWSFGATMYMALAGRAPFQGAGSTEVLKQLISAVPVDLAPLEGEAPDFVVPIVAKCLRKDPAERYQSADELRRALEAAVDHLEMSAGETVDLAPPRQGQTLLLHVEYQESDLTGAYREYEIGSHLGCGTYGDVFRAKELLSGKDVALKILKPRWVADPDAVARFRREATLLSRLSHRNIVRLHNFGRYGPSFFLAMDYLEGPTLEQAISERAPMDFTDIMMFVIQVFGGMHELHRVGTVHRDLKPSNIAMVGDKYVVFDFGMAHVKQADKLTMTGDILGSPSYMSPEQASGLPVTTASDIYALGVILYEMLSGKLPHEAASTHELLRKIVEEPPPPIGDYRDGLPGALAAMLEKMLSKNPEERPKANRVVTEFKRGQWRGLDRI